jgi:hypothetical protein
MEVQMKKYLVVLAVMFLFGGYGFAEEMTPGETPVKSDAGMVKKGHMMKDCCMMQDGKMMMMKDGKKMMMDADMDMPNGTMVMKDGTCTMKDGTKMMMKEGDRMDMDGNMMKKRHMMKDHVMMKDGKMMMMKDGKKMEMGADTAFPNGAVIMKDGTCTMKDGTKMMMKEGDRMDMDGKMMINKQTVNKNMK